MVAERRERSQSIGITNEDYRNNVPRRIDIRLFNRQGWHRSVSVVGLNVTTGARTWHFRLSATFFVWQRFRRYATAFFVFDCKIRKET